VTAENNRDPSAPDTHQARTDRLSRALELIGAVAHRDAYPEDIVAQLRNEGFDALDVVVAALAGHARQQPAARRAAERRIDVRSFSRPTPRELAARIVHQVPKVPFVLNGTLYDPKDVRRFDGQELHLLSVRGELVAFANRDVMTKVWELLYITPEMWEKIHTHGHPDVFYPPTPLPAAPATPPSSGYPQGPEPFGAEPWPPWPEDRDDPAGTYFYEDAGHEGWGEELYLRQNRNYPDLTEVGRGIFGLGDWNDVISAVHCVFRHGSGPTICVLHEHINLTGSTFTCCGCKELDTPGWNDRASSVQTW